MSDSSAIIAGELESDDTAALAGGTAEANSSGDGQMAEFWFDWIVVWVTDVGGGGGGAGGGGAGAAIRGIGRTIDCHFAAVIICWCCWNGRTTCCSCNCNGNSLMLNFKNINKMIKEFLYRFVYP